MNQLPLFTEASAGPVTVEQQVQSILARRRAMNASGQAGEDIANIRAAITNKESGNG